VLTLVGRHDWATSTTDDHLALTSASTDDKAFTGRAGLTYLFDSGVAPYISYATSFQPSAGAAAGQPFRPSTGKQVEAGVKYHPPGSNILVTLAAFDLTRDNIVTTDPTFVSRQIGAARVRGIEAEIKGNLTPNVELIASYTNQSSEIIESTNPFELGRPLPLTPRQQASVWGTYNFLNGPLAGLKLGAGARYVGANYSETETTNPILVPAATLFDALVQYDLSVLNPTLKGATLSVNATNLFDKYYVTYCYTNVYCSLGAGRAVLATLNYRW
jgi:iron complex outermembrane receptor protein